MKAIIIQEERFDELFDGFLNLLKVKARANGDEDEPGLSFRTVNYYACEFKDKVKRSTVL